MHTREHMGIHGNVATTQFHLAVIRKAGQVEEGICCGDRSSLWKNSAR